MAKGFVVDLKKCVGCKACVAVCKIRYASPKGISRRNVYTRDITDSRIFVSMACNQCDGPSCVPACPKGALSKDAASGVVTLNKSACVGCRRCEWACPYGAMVFEPAGGKMDKCDACVGFTPAAGVPTGPRCVEACHADALAWVDKDATFTQTAAELRVAGEHIVARAALTAPSVKFIKVPGVD
ncbi:MAG: 4Fe-4S binding protein [Actinobacteria bacterium]|nr:4Fe-4S binding protein [Actinomycetota bacterium]